MSKHDELTCATCQNIGIAYWDSGFTVSHHCLKEAVRRAEQMPRGADLFAHFRAFFDASADQRACRHYTERPLAPPDVLALLARINESGRTQVKFWSDESAVASRVEGKFVQSDQYADAPNGYRVFKILDVGRAEHARAAIAKATGEQP